MKHLASAMALLAALGVTPQSAAGKGDSTATITITADIDSAGAAVNGFPAGTAPLTIPLAAGRYLIAVYDQDLDSWFAPAAHESVEVAAGEHRTLHFRLRPMIHILSDPPGAEVFVGDSLAGTTPVVLRPPYSTLPLTLRKPGFVPAPGPPDWARSRGPVTATLTKDPEVMTVGEPMLVLPREEEPGDLRLVVTGGAALVSGIVAGYCKIQADQRSDLYIATGEASVLSERRRLDTIAAVALVATQVSLGLFTWFVLSE